MRGKKMELRAKRLRRPQTMRAVGSSQQFPTVRVDTQHCCQRPLPRCCLLRSSGPHEHYIKAEHSGCDLFASFDTLTQLTQVHYKRRANHAILGHDCADVVVWSHIKRRVACLDTLWRDPLTEY